jgi:hypothetical protein
MVAGAVVLHPICYGLSKLVLHLGHRVRNLRRPGSKC